MRNENRMWLLRVRITTARLWTKIYFLISFQQRKREKLHRQSLIFKDVLKHKQLNDVRVDILSIFIAEKNRKMSSECAKLHRELIQFTKLIFSCEFINFRLLATLSESASGKKKFDNLGNFKDSKNIQVNCDLCDWKWEWECNEYFEKLNRNHFWRIKSSFFLVFVPENDGKIFSISLWCLSFSRWWMNNVLRYQISSHFRHMS